jgi:hypothetical protein
MKGAFHCKERKNRNTPPARSGQQGRKEENLIRTTQTKTRPHEVPTIIFSITLLGTGRKFYFRPIQI